MLTIGSAIFGTAGIGGAFLAWRRDRRQGPIEATTATIADAVALSGAATAWVQYQTQKMKDQDGKIEDGQELNKQLVATLTTQRALVAMWGLWYIDLVERWSFWRARTEPPTHPRIRDTIRANTEESGL